MNLFAFPEPDFKNPILDEQASDVLTPSTGSAFKAGIDLGNLDAPVNFITDMNRAYKQPTNGVPAKLGVEEANKQYGIPGVLNFDRDILPEAAQVINERTMKRMAFEERLSRADFGQQGIAFVGQFAGQMFDPINIAASVIPVSKLPIASKLLDKLVTKPAFVQRGAAGAIEGFVGQAAVEPIYLMGDEVGFEEHTNADVMRNLAFGTVLGAGLNVTIGGAFDGAQYLLGKTVKQHEAAATTAFNQLLEGKIVNVEPVLRADPQLARTEQVRQNIKFIESSGQYGAPEGYGSITGPDTDLGLSNLKLFEKGESVIVNNLPRTVGKIDVLDLEGEVTPAEFGGSNEGYIKETEYGQYYLKPQTGLGEISIDRTKVEVLSNKLSQLFGDDLVLPSNIHKFNDGLAVGTPFLPNAVKVTPNQLSKILVDPEMPIETIEDVRNLISNSVIDAFLGNRDAFAYGNILIDKDTNRVVKIDQGGSLTFRAMGEMKDDFGGQIDELDAFLGLNDKNPDAASFIGFNATKNMLNAGVEKILMTDFQDIADLVLSMGLSRAQEEKILGALSGRMTYLRDRFPDAAHKAADTKGKSVSATPYQAYQNLSKQSKNMFLKLDDLRKSERDPLFKAIEEYQTSSVYLNDILRGGRNLDKDLDSDKIEWLKETTSLLDKASEIGKLEQDTLIYRWMPAKLFSEIGDQAYMSTSLYANKSPFRIDDHPSNNLLVVLNAPKGTKGFWPDAANAFYKGQNKDIDLDSTFSHGDGGEFEFVVGRGSKYVVTGPAVSKVSQEGKAYKEIQVSILPDEPPKTARPMGVKEIAAAASAYRDMPSSAAEPNILMPAEATSFNSFIPKAKTILEADVDPMLLEMVADLELKAKSILSEAEMKNLTSALKDETDKTEGYIGGMQQAMTCWRNG